MATKAKKAITNLKKYLTELEKINNVQQGNTWKASLKDTLDLFVGPESSISQRLDDLFFTKKEMIQLKRGGGVPHHVYDDTKKENFRNLIQNAIKQIESNGIYKNDKQKNLLSSFNNVQLISGIVVAIGIIYGIGNYLGKLEKDRELFQSEKQLEEIQQQFKDSQKENELLKKQNQDYKNQLEITQKNSDTN